MRPIAAIETVLFSSVRLFAVRYLVVTFAAVACLHQNVDILRGATFFGIIWILAPQGMKKLSVVVTPCGPGR